jgi:hypothetical protein
MRLGREPHLSGAHREEGTHGRRICYRGLDWPGRTGPPNHASDSGHLRGIFDRERGYRSGVGGLELVAKSSHRDTTLGRNSPDSGRYGAINKDEVIFSNSISGMKF